MADTTNPTVSKTDVQYAKDYYNIERDIEESLVRQNNTLLTMFGIRKSLNMSLLDNYKRTSVIKQLVQRSKEDEISTEKKLRFEQNETKRREIKATIESIQQRRKKYLNELDLLDKMKAKGWMPILWAMNRVWGLFKNLDEAAWEFRKEMGMTREHSDHLRQTAQRLSIEFMNIGVNVKGAYDAITALGKEMGSVHILSRDLIKTTAILKAQLGVSEEHTAGFLRNMAAVSHSTMETQENMGYAAAYMSAAAGVPLNVIMGDIGKATGNTLTMMSRIPNQVLRSSVELRKMGTSLKESANASRDILNFTDSVNAEMEASVLLGRSINLQHARELAYRRDLEGSTKEILRITKSISFENLDVFQQEAFARATGRSADELLRMIQAEKQWEAARRSTDPHVRAMVEKYESMRRASKEMQMSETDKLKVMIQQKANQDRMTAISAKWNQLVSKVAYIFLPIIDKLLGVVVDGFEGLVALTGSILLFGHKIGNVFISLGQHIRKIGVLGNIPGLKWLGPVVARVGQLGKLIQNVGLKFNSWAPSIQRVLGMFKFGGILNMFRGLGNSITKIFGSVLGKILMPVMFIWNIIKGIKGLLNDKELMSTKGFWEFNRKLIGRAIAMIWNAFSDLFFNLPNLILKGLWSVVKMIGAVLWAPFEWAGKKIADWWGGKSPSNLGLSIVKGIISVGAMIFDALTAPFRKGLAWIADKIPGMGKVAERLRGGVSDIIKKPMEAKMTAAYVPAVTVTPQGTQIAGAQTTKPAGEAEKKDLAASDKTLQDILTAINALNSNLSNGKIGIYLDGQLVSATLARQTEFRGGYGVNKM